MKEQIEELQKKFELTVDERKPIVDEGRIYYIVSGYKSNENLAFLIREEDELTKITELFESDAYLYQDYIAIKNESTIQIILKSISFRSSRQLDREEDRKFIEISMHYFKNELDICLRYAKEEDNISKFAKILRGARRFNRTNPLILEIENYKQKVEDIETDTRNIMNSILFDIEFTYGIGLETINIESLKRRFVRRRTLPNLLPTEKISLTYKKYIPELIEYFHIGEKVDYLPFKFICYYHIIEYFSDKSAYTVVANYIKKLITKPDFHTKTNKYVGQAINFFKKENDRYTTDKIKIDRVLKQFISRQEIESYLEEIERKDYFETAIELECSKPLKLPKIGFDSDSEFYQNLNKRIYSVRCSIVHSNPDFDDSKSIPFVPTPKNLEILRNEIELMHEIARTIIVESKE